MVNILEFDILDDVEDALRRSFSQVKEQFVTFAQEEGDIDVALASSIELEYILIVGDWAEGDADRGSDPLEIIGGLSYDSDQIQDIGEVFSGLVEDNLRRDEFAYPPNLDGVLPRRDSSVPIIIEFNDIIEAAGISPLEPEREPQDIPTGTKANQVNRILRESAENVVIDLFRREVWVRRGDQVVAVPVQEYIETNLDIQEDPEPPVDGTLPESFDEEEETEEEPEEDEEPDIDDFDTEDEQGDRFTFLLDNSINPRKEENFEAKAGKETKTIEMRGPYEFELGLQTRQLRFSTRNIEPYAPQGVDKVDGGIGDGQDAGMIGNSMPASAYPRTGIYIREHLKRKKYTDGIPNGSYALEIFNDLAWYGWFISSIYGGNYHASSYNNVKTTLFRIEKLAEDDIVEEPLINPLSQQQASARGLTTVPRINQGTDQEQPAPWLARRQYYELTDFGEESDAWTRINELLYGEDEE